MYRSGRRGDKIRHQSNRKGHRQKRSHDSDLRLKQQTRRNLTSSGTGNQINSLLGQNTSQRQVSSQSFMRGRVQHKIPSPNHITRGFNSRYQNNLQNLVHRQLWAQNYKSTLTESNCRSHKSNSVLKNGPTYRYKIPSSFTNPSAKASPYIQKSQIRYSKDTHLHGSTQSLYRNDTNSSHYINIRNPLNSTREKHELKKRQRRWSKFRKRGKMRYKRNNLLTNHGHQFQNHETYRNQNIQKNIVSGHTANRYVHPHAAVNHKLHRGNSHPHWIRHQAHMLRNKHHSTGYSNPSHASINHELITHAKRTPSSSYNADNVSSDSADGLDEHPRHRYLQQQTIKNHNSFGTPVRNDRNSDTNMDRLIIPSSNTFIRHQSIGQYQQQTSQHSENILIQEDQTSTQGTEHLTHTHSQTNSTSTVQQENKNSPTLGVEPPAKSQIHPQAHIPSLFQGYQAYPQFNKVNARFITRKSCNQTAMQQANSHTTEQNTGCVSSPRNSRVNQPTVKNQQNSESSVKPHKFSGTQSEVTRLEVSEGQAFISRNSWKHSFDLSTEVQDSHELNRDEDDDVDDEDLSEEEQTVATDLSVTSHAESPSYIYHPQSRVFSQVQAENTPVVSDPERAQFFRLRTSDSQEGLNLRNQQEISTKQQAPHENFKNGECHRKKSTRTYTWRRAAGRRYGEVIVALRNRKKLDLLIGDVDAHFVITRSKTKYGQEFLGFYVEEHKILSPNTTGIIGQFAYKTVGTMASTTTVGEGENNVGMKLAVLQPQQNMQYRVSEVNGFVSKRRSMLHKSHVRCLLIPNQGRGLVAGNPEDYLLPCLCC